MRAVPGPHGGAREQEDVGVRGEARQRPWAGRDERDHVGRVRAEDGRRDERAGGGGDAAGVARDRLGDEHRLQRTGAGRGRVEEAARGERGHELRVEAVAGEHRAGARRAGMALEQGLDGRDKAGLLVGQREVHGRLLGPRVDPFVVIVYRRGSPRQRRAMRLSCTS